MKKFGITLAIILSILMLLIGGGFIFANYVINSTLDQMVMTESITKEEAGITEQIIQKEEESKVVNIAVFGLDQNGDGSEPS